MILTVIAALSLALPVQQPQPYRDPPFACEVVDYGTAPPEVPAPADDPLCVRYDKTNITVSTLGVFDFLAAEPGRVAIVAGKCSYWQQDHWIVRATPDTTPIVEWQGSYWYDGRTGTAGGIMRGLRVGGEPADGEAFAAALAPLIGEEAAADLAAYAADGGGGGVSFALPAGFGAEVCSASGPPDGPSGPSRTASPAARAADVAATGEPRGAGAQLAATGSVAPLAVGTGLLVAVGVLRRLAASR